MHIILKSAPLSKSTSSTHVPISSQNIYLFYFLSKEDTGKLNRLSSALEHNIANPHITKVFIFTNNGEKQKQALPDVEYISTSKFYFSQIQDFIEERGLQGYMVIVTPYTTFGNNLQRLKGTSLHAEAAILNINAAIANTGAAQKYNMCANIFVFHSNMNVPKERRKIFNINMTRFISCSKILYLFYILNYRLHNESGAFQCYTAEPNPFMDFSQYFQDILISRTQHKQDRQSPFILMEPADITIVPMALLTGIQFGNRYDIRKDTNTLFHYVREKLEKKMPFVIPRIAGIENQLAVNLSVLSNGTYRNIANPQIQRWLQPYLAIMKKNAGVKITTVESALLYAKLYARVFGQCDMYTDWPSWGAVGRVLGRSQQYWRDRYRKPTLWAFVYDLYHTIYARPWTHALKGKRVLIISSFVESYKKKVDAGVLDKIYGIDLFPECELLFLKPPQTQGSNPSEEFHVELERFGKQIEKIKDQFDVALCSCGGYGNLVSGKIFEMGKSAIYVGGVLQMYFGVLGQRWLRERPDVVRLFMNEHWSRPQDSEKPKDYKQVEGSCYW